MKDGIQSHIESLKRKHAELEESIKTVIARAAPQQWLLSTLKRRKLKIKDEIERLRAKSNI
jgi:hypothetical protein